MSPQNYFSAMAATCMHLTVAHKLRYILQFSHHVAVTLVTLYYNLLDNTGLVITPLDLVPTCISCGRLLEPFNDRNILDPKVALKPVLAIANDNLISCPITFLPALPRAISAGKNKSSLP